MLVLLLLLVLESMACCIHHHGERVDCLTGARTFKQNRMEQHEGTVGDVHAQELQHEHLICILKSWWTLSSPRGYVYAFAGAEQHQALL